MTKSKNTKKALLASILSMLLCAAMLVGSTFAWFTDSVTSGKNRIVAGNLDVELMYKNAATATTGEDGWANAATAESADPKFFVDKNGNEILWEPGVMAVTQFKVTNAGSLALKYQFTTNKGTHNSITVDDVPHDLSEVIKFAVIDNDQYTDSTTRDQILAINPTFKDFAEFTGEGWLLPADKTDTAYPDVSDSETFTVVAYWAPGANDNIYNVNNTKATGDGENLYIDIEIRLFATQVEYENDSFDNQYDKNAWLDHLTANANGTYTDGDKTYVKDNNDYVPIAEDENIKGLYKEVVGEGEEAGKIFIVDEISTTEIKENETTGLYETVVEEGVDTTLYVLGDTELVEVESTTPTSSLYKEVAPEGENSRLYAKGFSGVVEVQADSTTDGLYTAVGDDGEKFVTTADAMEAVAPQGGNVTVIENIEEINTSNEYVQNPFLNISATETPTNIDLSDKVLSIESVSGKNGIKASEGASATISNGTITMDKTYGSNYPVVKAEKAEITLDNMTVELTATSGNCVSAGSDGGKVIVKDTTVKGPNSTYSNAVYSGSQSTLELENAIIIGGIRVENNGNIIIKSGDFTQATFYFGGSSGTHTVYAGTFAKNPTTLGLRLAEGSTVAQEGNIWVVTAG